SPSTSDHQQSYPSSGGNRQKYRQKYQEKRERKERKQGKQKKKSQTSKSISSKKQTTSIKKSQSHSTHPQPPSMGPSMQQQSHIITNSLISNNPNDLTRPISTPHDLTSYSERSDHLDMVTGAQLRYRGDGGRIFNGQDTASRRITSVSTKKEEERRRREEEEDDDDGFLSISDPNVLLNRARSYSSSSVERRRREEEEEEDEEEGKEREGKEEEDEEEMDIFGREMEGIDSAPVFNHRKQRIHPFRGDNNEDQATPYQDKPATQGRDSYVTFHDVPYQIANNEEQLHNSSPSDSARIMFDQAPPVMFPDVRKKMTEKYNINAPVHTHTGSEQFVAGRFSSTPPSHVDTSKSSVVMPHGHGIMAPSSLTTKDTITHGLDPLDESSNYHISESVRRKITALTRDISAYVKVEHEERMEKEALETQASKPPGGARLSSQGSKYGPQSNSTTPGIPSVSQGTQSVVNPQRESLDSIKNNPKYIPVPINFTSNSSLTQSGEQDSHFSGTSGSSMTSGNISGKLHGQSSLTAIISPEISKMYDVSRGRVAGDDAFYDALIATTPSPSSVSSHRARAQDTRSVTGAQSSHVVPGGQAHSQPPSSTIHNGLYPMYSTNPSFRSGRSGQPAATASAAATVGTGMHSGTGTISDEPFKHSSKKNNKSGVPTELIQASSFIPIINIEPLDGGLSSNGEENEISVDLSSSLSLGCHLSDLSNSISEPVIIPAFGSVVRIRDDLRQQLQKDRQRLSARHDAAARFQSGEKEGKRRSRDECPMDMHVDGRKSSSHSTSDLSSTFSHKRRQQALPKSSDLSLLYCSNGNNSITSKDSGPLKRHGTDIHAKESHLFSLDMRKLSSSSLPSSNTHRHSSAEENLGLGLTQSKRAKTKVSVSTTHNHENISTNGIIKGSKPFFIPPLPQLISTQGGSLPQIVSQTNPEIGKGVSSSSLLLGHPFPKTSHTDSKIRGDCDVSLNIGDGEEERDDDDIGGTVKQERRIIHSKKGKDEKNDDDDEGEDSLLSQNPNLGHQQQRDKRKKKNMSQPSHSSKNTSKVAKNNNNSKFVSVSSNGSNHDDNEDERQQKKIKIDDISIKAPPFFPDLFPLAPPFLPQSKFTLIFHLGVSSFFAIVSKMIAKYFLSTSLFLLIDVMCPLLLVLWIIIERIVRNRYREGEKQNIEKWIWEREEWMFEEANRQVYVRQINQTTTDLKRLLLRVFKEEHKYSCSGRQDDGLAAHRTTNGGDELHIARTGKATHGREALLHRTSSLSSQHGAITAPDTMHQTSGVRGSFAGDKEHSMSSKAKLYRSSASKHGYVGDEEESDDTDVTPPPEELDFMIQKKRKQQNDSKGSRHTASISETMQKSGTSMGGKSSAKRHRSSSSHSSLTGSKTNSNPPLGKKEVKFSPNYETIPLLAFGLGNPTSSNNLGGINAQMSLATGSGTSSSSASVGNSDSKAGSTAIQRQHLLAASQYEVKAMLLKLYLDRVNSLKYLNAVLDLCLIRQQRCEETMAQIELKGGKYTLKRRPKSRSKSRSKGKLSKADLSQERKLKMLANDIAGEVAVRRSRDLKERCRERRSKEKQASANGQVEYELGLFSSTVPHTHSLSPISPIPADNIALQSMITDTAAQYSSLQTSDGIRRGSGVPSTTHRDKGSVSAEESTGIQEPSHPGMYGLPLKSDLNAPLQLSIQDPKKYHPFQHSYSNSVLTTMYNSSESFYNISPLTLPAAPPYSLTMPVIFFLVSGIVAVLSLGPDLLQSTSRDAAATIASEIKINQERFSY
ncbi:hypothetical protein ADUPG1_012485, partial [Aduncisulcus paluster]